MKKEESGMIVLKTPADVEYFLRRESNASYSPQWSSHEKIKEYNTKNAILSAMLSVLLKHYKNGIHQAEYGVLAYRMKEKNPALSQLGGEELISEVDSLIGERGDFFKSKRVECPCAGLVHKVTTEGKEYFKRFC